MTTLMKLNARSLTDGRQARSPLPTPPSRTEVWTAKTGDCGERASLAQDAKMAGGAPRYPPSQNLHLDSTLRLIWYKEKNKTKLQYRLTLSYFGRDFRRDRMNSEQSALPILKKALKRTPFKLHVNIIFS